MTFYFRISRLMTTRIFDITSYIWWESDDIYKWPDNSFYSAENVDIRKQMNWVKLSCALTDTWLVFDATITAMLHTDELWIPWWLITCLSNGKIYLDSNLMVTLSTWTTAWNQIIWIWYNVIGWTKYIYLVSKTDSWTGQIHRTNTSLTDWSWISLLTYNVQPWTVLEATTFNNWGLLYIGVQNKILMIDALGSLTYPLILPADEVFKKITKFQNKFYLYLNKGNWWKQYRWDWISESPEYSQEWTNLGIMAVTSDWAYDYAILWFNEEYSWLYQIAWTQKSELRVNLEKSPNSRVLDWYISIRKWIVYISWWKSGQSSNYWIYSYWNYYPWTPRSLVQEFSWTTTKFKFHTHTIATSYFADANNKVWYVTFDNPALVYPTKWYIVTKMYDWIQWEEYSRQKIEVAYKLVDWSSIKIYIRTDFDDDFTLLKTLTFSDNWNEKNYTINWDEIQALELWNFNEVQLKIELYKGTSWTPEIKRITSFLEVINN